MPGTELCQLDRPGASPFRSTTAGFSGCRFVADWRAACHRSSLGWKLSTAFRSPATAARFQASIPGSQLPDLPLRLPACRFRRPFGLSAPRPSPVCSRIRSASVPPARCGFHCLQDRHRLTPPLPFGILTSLRIKAFCAICCPSARLPVPPDLRSLPAANSLSLGAGRRIIVPGPLRPRRLAVPQTSWNHLHYAP
jgi:hypothetical protein